VTQAYVSADVTQAVGNALSAVARIAGRISLIDWILIGLAALLVAWGWVRAAAFARLGTIEIDDLKCDDASQGPGEIKAALQQKLGERGLLPASGVPSGSPTKDNISAAVASAPIAQAAWLGALIKVIPTPPASTSFKLSGTLSTKLETESGRFGLIYQLVCQGPVVSVTVQEERGPDWSSVVDAASKDIYRLIAEAAPAIYPRWARWSSRDALTRFGDALRAEREPVTRPCAQGRAQPAPYESALTLYRAASELDPDNMLARLRAANCLERGASELEGDERVARRIEALEAYISVRLRQPTIFSAGYRASVLLSNLADRPPQREQDRHRLRIMLHRLDRERFAPGDDPSRHRWRAATHGLRRAVRNLLAPEPHSDELASGLNRAANRESRLARHRLRPLWTIVNEQRFRHRFEPTGRERRQLRKALGIAKMCIRARRGRDERGRRRAPVSDLTQLGWRAWVWCRFLAGRSYVAGWQAHYNAACFYALLPAASGEGAPLGGARLRRLALKHLRRAIDQADAGELQCLYVRDEDPDLEVLRKQSRDGFKRVLGPLCPDELIVHFAALRTDPAWRLHVWGDALAPSAEPHWTTPTVASGPAGTEAVFRVRIFDENKSLAILAHTPAQKAQPVWTVTPIEFNDQVWLYPGDARVYAQPRRDRARR
jgi:hypothetical protein